MVLELLCFGLVLGVLLYYHVPVLFVCASLYVFAASMIGLVFLIHRRWFRAFLKKEGIILESFNICPSGLGSPAPWTWLKYKGRYEGTATRNCDGPQPCHLHISGYLFAFICAQMSIEFAISTYTFQFDDRGEIVSQVRNFTEEGEAESS